MVSDLGVGGSGSCGRRCGRDGAGFSVLGWSDVLGRSGTAFRRVARNLQGFGLGGSGCGASRRGFGLGSGRFWVRGRLCGRDGAGFGVPGSADELGRSGPAFRLGTWNLCLWVDTCGVEAGRSSGSDLEERFWDRLWRWALVRAECGFRLGVRALAVIDVRAQRATLNAGSKSDPCERPGSNAVRRWAKA